jgi:IS30 family transposase
MNYKHLSQIERYQIYSLMKANRSITQVVYQLGRHKSTISRELGRNEGCRGYRPNQACKLTLARSQVSRNAHEIKPWVMCQADVLLGLQWRPEQIAGKLPMSHETLYFQVYADKVNGGKLWKNLRGQKQKRKRYAGGQNRRWQIHNNRPLSERSAHIEDRKKLGHW